MGAGGVLTEGNTLAPTLQISTPAGGPLLSVRNEVVALLCLLRQLHEKADALARLTIVIDCLYLLQCLSEWGRANYRPGPKEVIHF